MWVEPPVRAWLAPLIALVLSGALAQAQTPPAPQAAPMIVAPPGGPVQPDSLSVAAAQIEALLADGQGDAAIDAARRLMRSVTQRVGFGVTNARLTTAPAEGFGMFESRVSNIYNLDEPIHAYVEVFGFSMTPQPDGSNRLLFDVTFTLDDAEGRQMTDALIPMGEVLLDSFSQPLDGYFHLTYRVTGATGRVMLRTQVTDRATGTMTEFTLPVVFQASGQDKR